eukprot:5074768-Pyramimonas_sp.AAC.2
MGDQPHAGGTRTPLGRHILRCTILAQTLPLCVAMAAPKRIKLDLTVAGADSARLTLNEADVSACIPRPRLYWQSPIVPRIPSVLAVARNSE